MARVAKTTTQTTGTKNTKKELGMELVILCQCNHKEYKEKSKAFFKAKSFIASKRKAKALKSKRIKKAINTILFAIVGSVLLYAAIEKYNEPDTYTTVGTVTENSTHIVTVDGHKWGYDTKYPDGTPVAVEFDGNHTLEKDDDIPLNVW